MKKIVINLILPVIFLVACSKNGGNYSVPPEQLSIGGKWNVDTVNVYFYNAAGLLDSSKIAYPLPLPAGLYYPLYFQFNNDHSWLEAVVVRVDTTVVAKGTYTYSSGNTFNLIYPDATPPLKNELCNIVSLSNTSFTFSKQLPAVFNGTDSGSIKYVYKLIK